MIFFLHHVPSVSVAEMQSSSIWNRVRPASPCHEHDLRKYFQVNCFRMVYLLNWKGKSVVTRFEWKIAIRLRNAIAIFRMLKLGGCARIVDIETHLSFQRKKWQTNEMENSKAIMFFFVWVCVCRNPHNLRSATGGGRLELGKYHFYIHFFLLLLHGVGLNIG